MAFDETVGENDLRLERNRIVSNTGTGSSGGWNPGSIKPGGWLILLLLLGLLGYFGWKHVRPGEPGANVAQTNGGNAGDAGLSGNLDPQQVAEGDVLVCTSGTKQDWLSAEADKFNAQTGGHVRMLKPVESRDAMQQLLNGKLQPTIWSPSSPVWTERLVQLRSGILDESDPQMYRVVFKSPLVFLTTKEKAGVLRPILTGSTPFTTLAQRGNFKFGYADPLNASSGMLTMSLIINEYTRTHGNLDPVQAASSPGFAAFLGQLNHGLVKSDTEGSSRLEKAYEANTGSRDFITAYESAALAAVTTNPDLTMLYPQPTANADQGAAILNATWVTPQQKAAAQKFLQFIGTPAAQDDGVQLNFRPAVNGAQALSRKIGGQVGGFQASYTSVELPPYDALNEAAAQYRALLR